MDEAEPLISVESLTHRFQDGVLGLDALTLTVRKGDFLVLAGRNGSGKTLLMRHLIGLVRPDSGRVLYRGMDIRKDIRRARTGIGLVFQDSEAQIIGQTVAEDVAFGPSNLGLIHPRNHAARGKGAEAPASGRNGRKESGRTLGRGEAAGRHRGRHGHGSRMPYFRRTLRQSRLSFHPATARGDDGAAWRGQDYHRTDARTGKDTPPTRRASSSWNRASSSTTEAPSRPIIRCSKKTVSPTPSATGRNAPT